MAPTEKKWSDAAELDLCVAIIYGNQSRHDWPRITDIMNGLGYSFTKDAMSQHFTKTVLQKFKARIPEDVVAATEATPPASATKPKATPRKGAASTPRKRTKNGVKGQAADAADNNNNDEVDDEMALDATPTKKAKKEEKVKKEEKAKKEEEPATPPAAAAADQSTTSDSEEKVRASDAESSA